jgi:RNA polymerase sigma-70 factor (ECF subfamily)
VDTTERTREQRLTALVEQVHQPVRRYLARRAHPADVDDVLAETLLVLWRRLDDVPPEAPLAWTYAVARRCLANAQRSARRRDALAQRLHDTDAPPTATSEREDDVAAAVAQLRPDDREVLHLWAWEGLEPREIATVLAITANAASLRLHRARTRLRTVLLEQVPARQSATPAGHTGAPDPVTRTASTSSEEQR